MPNAHTFLSALAMVLGVAAVTTVIFQRLRQPVVLGYVLAGLIIGPHVPTGLVADTQVVHTLSELGVVLLMFSLGLEFSLRKLVQVGLTAGVTALVQCTLMAWLGFLVGRWMGWTPLESLFTAAIVAISSTTIIAKAFDEQNVRGRLREVVVGVLIVEDLIAILLMATLTAVASGAGASAGALGVTFGKLGAFLIGVVGVGLLVVPRGMRAIIRLGRPETTLIASVAVCFGVALLAQTAGYSVALGAFLAGSLIAESGEEKVVEPLVRPVRDIFAAIFFVSVGMLIEPVLIVRHLGAVVALTAIVILGKLVGVALGAFLTGNGTRTSLQAGLSMAQIGEFSFILAGLGLSLGATGEFLYPIAVAVSAITTLTTPWLIRASGPLASLVDRKLPRSLQTFVTLYGSWIEALRTGRTPKTPFGRVRRLVGLLALDAALLAGVVIGVALGLNRARAFLGASLGLGEAPVRLLVGAVAALVALPFVLGIVGTARRLGAALAEQALPTRTDGKLDLAATPRRVLVVTLQLAGILGVGIPLVAVTQPFLPGVSGGLVFVAAVVAFGVVFWRSATELQGHVRAGAQAIVATLAAQSRARDPVESEALADIHAVMPGIGEPVAFRLGSASPAVGRSLAQLNLRGLTGATVLAIRRGDGDVLVPSAQEVLEPEDVLALAGTRGAIDAARSFLGGAV